MEQDYLKRQIDQLGLVLAKLLGDILGLKNQGKDSECITLADNIMKTELGIGFAEFAAVPNEQFIGTLKSVKDIDDEGLNKLADILLAIAELQQDNASKYKLLEQVMEIDKHLETNNKTLNFDRYLKIAEIKKGMSI